MIAWESEHTTVPLRLASSPREGKCHEYIYVYTHTEYPTKYTKDWHFLVVLWSSTGRLYTYPSGLCHKHSRIMKIGPGPIWYGHVNPLNPNDAPRYFEVIFSKYKDYENCSIAYIFDIVQLGKPSRYRASLYQMAEWKNHCSVKSIACSRRSSVIFQDKRHDIIQHVHRRYISHHIHHNTYLCTRNKTYHIHTIYHVTKSVI